jgi:hypothetical protein
MKRVNVRICQSIALSLVAVLCAGAAAAQTIRVGPSGFCHVTDGAFTDCSPPPGVEEWSDIDFLPFLGANVYSDQRVAPASLFLMYDVLGNHVPLGPAQSFDIRFDVVEDGALEHYEVHCFGNGAAQVVVDGVPAAGTEGISCAPGFGLSPTSGFFDVFVELDVPMNVVYSPDIPLFWSTAAPHAGCRPQEPGCTPDGSRGNEPTSATIVSANSDGSTVITKVPLDATPADFCTPGGGGILGGLIDAVVPPEGSFRNHGDFVRQVVRKTREALASLVNSGALTRVEANHIESCILSARAQSDAGKK